MHRIAMVVSVVLFLATAARADDAETQGSFELESDGNQAGPDAAPASTNQEGELEVVEDPTSANQSKGGLYAGVHIVVPFFLTKTRVDNFLFEDFSGDAQPLGMSAGFGLELHGGYEFMKGFGVEGGLGFMGNGFSDGEGATLGLFWLSANARYAFYTESAFVPYGIAGLSYNTWTVTFDDDALDSLDSKSAGGLQLGGGAMYEFSTTVALDFGLQLRYSAPGSFFESGVVWLYPYLGANFFF